MGLATILGIFNTVNESDHISLCTDTPLPCLSPIFCERRRASVHRLEHIWHWINAPSQTSICNLSLFGLPCLFTPSLFEWMCARVWWWKMPKVRKKERENNHTLNWQDSNSRFSDWTNSAAFTRLRLRNVLVFLRRNVWWSNVYPTITICVITASPSRSITLEIGFVWKETVVFVIIIIFFFTLFG